MLNCIAFFEPVLSMLTTEEAKKNYVQRISEEFLFWKADPGSALQIDAKLIFALLCVKVHAPSTGRQEAEKLSEIYLPCWRWNSERIPITFLSTKKQKNTWRMRSRDRCSMWTLQTCILLLLLVRQIQPQRTGEFMLFIYLFPYVCQFLIIQNRNIVEKVQKKRLKML